MTRLPEGSYALLDCPGVKTTEGTLDDFLRANGIGHFSAREILTVQSIGLVVDEPPRVWWNRIIGALRLAEILREQMGCPLYVSSGYRPPEVNERVGGSKGSRHLSFRAVDLNLPPSMRNGEMVDQFQRTAVAMYDDVGERMEMGLGLYRRVPWRVHFDTGSRRRHWPGDYVKEVRDRA